MERLPEGPKTAGPPVPKVNLTEFICYRRAVMRKLIFGAAALFLLVAGTASGSEGVTPILKMDTTYHFMFFNP